MFENKKPYEIAAILFKAMGVLSAIATVGIGVILALLLVPLLSDPATLKKIVLPAFFLILGIIITVLQFSVGKAVREHKNWGRKVGIVIAVFQLLGFPIGTIIGGYILWCLTKGWNA